MKLLKPVDDMLKIWHPIEEQLAYGGLLLSEGLPLLRKGGSNVD